MRVLRVGDPHIKPNNLEESERLLGFIMSKAVTYKVDRVEIEGDLFDTHDIVRLKVLNFWDRWLNTLHLQDFKTIVLVGNHDMSGQYDSNYSPLSALSYIEMSQTNGQGLLVVQEPILDRIFGYMPYIHDNNKFIEEANKLADRGARVLVSHPNYKGAVYDNGHSIDNGIDSDLIDSRILHLIGGHIHTELELGRIWYIGSPRWLTKSCANKKKGIWFCTHDDVTGQIISKEFISTESVCTPIISIVWKEGEEKPEIPSNAKVDIELVGSSDWVTKQKRDLKQVSVSSKITDIKKSRERKSGRSFMEFLTKHYETNPERREKLINYLKGLQIV